MKDAFIVIGFALAAIVVGVWLYLHGSPLSAVQLQGSGASVVPGVAAPFTILAAGTQSTVSERKNYVINSEDELRQLWKMTDETGQAPVIDFAANQVIAVFAGQESSAGYTITVSSVEDGSSRIVAVMLTKPGGSCIVAQSLTSPYQIIAVPKTTLPLEHRDVESVTSCL